MKTIKRVWVVLAIVSLSGCALDDEDTSLEAGAASYSLGSAPSVTVLNDTALGGLGSGSTIGPDNALYVTNGNDGTLLRINRNNGSSTVVGTGLPQQVVGIGGAMDVAFLGDRAYVLVTLAGADVGAPDSIMGIYRLRNAGQFALFADLGAWSAAHPPVDPDWYLAQGVQYSMDVWHGGFVVTDAHLARLIRVDRAGHISELFAYDSTDAVPIGLESENGKLFVASPGPIPHLPSTSTISKLKHNGSLKLVASWDEDYSGNIGLLVDVEMGRHDRMYGLLQGFWDLEPVPDNEGLPAAPNTGELVKVRDDGTFRTLVSGLNQPTSLELDGNKAFVVTLNGTVLRIDGL